MTCNIDETVTGGGINVSNAAAGARYDMFVADKNVFDARYLNPGSNPNQVIFESWAVCAKIIDTP